jgi:hypothetical protein
MSGPEIGTSPISWALGSRFYLKTEKIQSPKRRVFKQVRTMDNVQESRYFNDKPSSQTFRFKMYPIYLIDVCVAMSYLLVTSFIHEIKFYLK